MSYFRNGFVFPSAPDWNELAAVFPPDIGLVAYRHRSATLFLLDAWNCDSHEHYPFTDPLDEFVQSDELVLPVETRQIIEQLSRLVAVIQREDTIYGDLLIPFTAVISTHAKRQTFFFASDDEGADLACLAENGSLLAFKFAASFYEIAYRRESGWSMTPASYAEDLEEGDTGYSPAIVEALRKLPFLKVNEPHVIEGGDHLQYNVLALWPSAYGDPEQLLGIGSFDALNDVGQSCEVVFRRECAPPEPSILERPMPAAKPFVPEAFKAGWSRPTLRYRAISHVLEIIRQGAPLEAAQRLFDTIADLIDADFIRHLYRVLEYRGGVPAKQWRDLLMELLPSHAAAFPPLDTKRDPHELFDAIDANDLKAVKRILIPASRYGWRLDTVLRNGKTPMEAAAESERDEIAELLDQYESGRDFGALTSKRLERVQEKAEAGDPRGIYEMARRYLSGSGDLPKNPQMAMQYFMKAAEQHYGAAIMMVGVLHNEGEGVEKNREAAIPWLTEAAMMGNVGAQKELASTLIERAKDDDVDEGISWLEIAAREEDEEAAYRLSEIYRNGELTDPEEDEALDWLVYAASQGHGPALFDLAVRHQEGDGVPQNDALAVELLQQGADFGDIDCKFTLGFAYEEGRGVQRNRKVAREFYREVGEVGDARGWYRLGLLRFEGPKGGEPDPDGAKKYFERGAKLGDVACRWALAQTLMTSANATSADYRRAARLLHETAAEGWLQSKYDLALGWVDHIFRDKVKADDGSVPAEERFAGNANEAKKLLREAAAEGHEQSQALLRELGWK